MNIPASISVFPTFNSELTLCARWLPHLLDFEGLAKLCASWVTALYATSSEEIFLEKQGAIELGQS